jgi:tetratricopeptide (TPR) repeat protein
MKKCTLFFLLVSSFFAIGQAKVKNAYKQYGKGEIDRAVELLNEVKVEDAAREFFYVRALCTIESAATPEQLLNVYNDLIRANPAFESDEKEVERLEKNFELTPTSFGEVERRFFALAFNYYQGLNTLPSWKEHNARFTASPYRDTAYYFEGMSAFSEANAGGGDKVKLQAIIRDYPTKSASKLAYNALGELEFAEAVLANQSAVLRDFSIKFSKHARSQEALNMARTMDFKRAMAESSISNLEGFVKTYSDSPERRAALNTLDSVYYESLLKGFDVATFRAYHEQFTTGVRRLKADSICNYNLHLDVIRGQYDDEKWQKVIGIRNPKSYQFTLVNRLIENLKTTRVPYLNDRYNYTLRSIQSGAPNAFMYQAEVILREGDSWFRVRKNNKWGLIYVDPKGSVEVLAEPLYDDIGTLKNGFCFQVERTNSSGAQERGIIDGTGNWIVPVGQAYSDFTFLERGKILATKSSSSELIDLWSQGVVPFAGTVERVYTANLLREQDAKGQVRAIYTLDGERLLLGTSISIIQHLGSGVVNVKSEGTNWLVVGDSLVPSPTTEFVYLYQDSKNYISGKKTDEWSVISPFTIVEKGVKKVFADANGFNEDGGFAVLWNKSGVGQVYSTTNFSQAAKNVQACYRDNNILAVQTGDAGVQLLRSTKDGYQSVAVAGATAVDNNIIYVEEDFYGEYHDGYDGDGEHYDGGFYLEGLNEGFITSTQLISQDELKIELVPLEFASSRGVVDTTGRLLYNDERSLWTHSWVAQTYSSGRFLVDPDGISLTGNWLGWIDEFTFLFEKGSEVYVHQSKSKRFSQGTNVKLCDDCSVNGAVRPGLYEVTFNGFPAYVQVSSGKANVLGNYLNSSFCQFAIKFKKMNEDYLEDSDPSYYTYSRAIDNLGAPNEFKYPLAVMKLEIALALSSYEVSSCIQELKKFLEFTKDEKVRIYEMVASHYFYDSQYGNAVDYFDLLEELLPVSFIERYGWMAGRANKEDYNRSKAKEIFLKYTNYDEVRAWDQLGYIYFEESSYESAIESWKAALAAARRDKMESYWSSGSVFINIGAAYANLNNTDKMCEYYRIALGSGNEEAQRRYNYQCK